MNLRKCKFVFIFFLIYTLNILFISGCNKNKEPIKIGIIGTMSGVNSDLSVSGRRGVKLAADEINSEGGVNGKLLELIVEDDMNDEKIAENKYRELINQNVKFVIGPYTSGMIVNSMNYLKDKDVLVLGPTISADSLSNKDDNFIRYIASTKEQATVLNEVANKNNHKKFAIIYDSQNSGFNDALYNNFKTILEKNGGQVVLTKTFSSNEKNDFYKLAENIIASNADAVFTIGNSASNAEIAQQLRKAGSTIQMYAPLWANTIDLIKKGGTAVEGMFIVGGIDINDNSEEFIKFKKNFIDRFGENPTFASVYSYEATKSLYLAMKMGPNLKTETIKNNIIKIKSYKGLQGNYEIDRFGDNTRKYIVFKIENGTLRRAD